MKQTKARKPLSEEQLDDMIEQATVDAHDESEQLSGWSCMFEENLAVPFETTVLGVPVKVEQVTQNNDEQIVAICTRGKGKQSIPILDLPLPEPLPPGAEWIEAYRHWRRGAG